MSDEQQNELDEQETQPGAAESVDVDPCDDAERQKEPAAKSAEAERVAARGEPRLDGIDADALAARIQDCTEHFNKHVDELDYRNFDWYMWRASLRFVAGDPIMEVVDDLFLAARCVYQRSDLHLSRHPNQKFLTRRVLPVELGLISGQPMVTQDLANNYGIPMTLLLARNANDQVFKEASLLTHYFRRGSCINHQDLAGLGALVWSGAIGAVGRGFDDEAMLCLNTFFEARKAFEGKPAGAAAPLLRRYDGLNTALALLLNGKYEQVGGLLAMLVEGYLADLANKLGEKFIAPETPQRYLDLSSLALLAIAALRQVAIPLPDEGSIAPYREFVHVFTTAPVRELEEPELGPDERLLLAQMGMDPDKVQEDLKAQAREQMDALAAAQREAHAQQSQQSPESNTDESENTEPEDNA